MASARKRSTAETDSSEQEIREQEVLRANRELAAYFKGRRTEREARAALKIVKAFIRDREQMDPAKRRPLPGAAPSQRPKSPGKRKTSATTRRRKRMPQTGATVSVATGSGSSTHEDGVGEHRGIAVAFPHD